MNRSYQCSVRVYYRLGKGRCVVDEVIEQNITNE